MLVCYINRWFVGRDLDLDIYSSLASLPTKFRDATWLIVFLDLQNKQIKASPKGIWRKWNINRYSYQGLFYRDALGYIFKEFTKFCIN